MYAYIYFYHRTLSAPSSPLLTHSGARHDFGSPRYLWRGETKLRGLIRGVLLGRGAAVRALLTTCAPSPCASKILWKPEAFPLRGLGPPRTERVWGVASVARSGPGELLLAVFFRFGWTRICTTPVSLHRVKIIGFWGKEQQQAIMQAVVSYMYYIFALLLSLS